jgi:hypothetical protein
MVVVQTMTMFTLTLFVAILEKYTTAAHNCITQCWESPILIAALQASKDNALDTITQVDLFLSFTHSLQPLQVSSYSRR